VDVIKLRAMIGWQVGGLMRFENWGIVEWFDVGAQRWGGVNWKAIIIFKTNMNANANKNPKTQWIDIMC
jgi:hypothetical protein